MSIDHNDYIDALRLTSQQRLEILSKLKKRITQPSRADLRLSDRRQFYQSKVYVEMFHPGGTHIRYRVQAVNLSTQGIGVLHGSFSYTGTPVIVELSTLDDKPVKLKGKVVRCQLIEGRIHEIGILFTLPIALDQFIEGVEPDASGSTPEQAAGPTRLRGRVLYIESSLDNRELMGFMTDQIGVELTSVETLEQAGQAIGKQSFDLAIVDLDIDEKAIETIRGFDYGGPIVGASANTDLPPEDLAEQSGCTDILVMPFSAQSLSQQLEKFLLRDTLCDANAKPLMSEQWSNPQMRPVIMNYLTRLEGTVQRLDQLFNQGDHTALRRLTYDLKSSAGGFGYSPISELAGLVVEMIDAEAEQADMKEQLKNLIDLCSSACLSNRKPKS